MGYSFVYMAIFKPCSNKKKILFMKYFNLKWVIFDPKTIGGFMWVNRILNWGTQNPGNIDTLPVSTVSLRMVHRSESVPCSIAVLHQLKFQLHIWASLHFLFVF